MNLLKYITILFWMFFGFQTSIAQINSLAINNTIKVLNFVKGQQFDSIINMFNAETKRMIDAEGLEASWKGLNMYFGDFKSYDEIKESSVDNLIITSTIITLTKSKLELTLSFDSTNKISGIFFKPLTKPYSPAAYSNPRYFYDIRLKTPVKDFESDAVLSMPNVMHKVPVIILVGGSGPTNKDGDIGPNKPYRDLAEGLATKGIAVYRYDKRAVSYGKKLSKNKNLTVKVEYLTDLQSIVKQMKTMDGIDPERIFIAGHSQGGFLLPYFESQIKGIKGFIGLAPGFRNLETTMLEQLNYIDSLTSNPLDKAKLAKTINTLKYINNSLNINSPQDSLLPGITAGYLLHLRTVAPANFSNGLNQYPVLILRGSKDYQVTDEDINGWKELLKDAKAVTFKNFENLNHVFIATPTSARYTTPDAYQKPGNVDKTVIDFISDWVLKLP